MFTHPVQFSCSHATTSLSSIFTNPVQFSRSHATASHPRVNFSKPCSVQLFPCNNIPSSAQFLQTLFSSVVPVQEHPTLGSIFTNPVQFSCPHAATSRPRLNCYKPCSVQLFPCNSIPPRLNCYKPCSVQLFPCSNTPPCLSCYMFIRVTII